MLQIIETFEKRSGRSPGPLGSRAAQFTHPLWRELADAVQGQSYMPEVPQAFCAALYLRCGQPLAALHAATAIAGAERDPTLLHWRAIAIDDPQLQRDWSAFQTACDWLEPTDQTPAWFPAWYLVEHQAALAALDGMTHCHPVELHRPSLRSRASCASNRKGTGLH